MGLIPQPSLTRDDGRPLPPPRLRRRVHGTRDIDTFLAVGQRCRRNLETALERVGQPLRAQRAVLDFGCGCGRTLLWLSDLAPEARLVGTDTDRRAIRWCRRHLPFAEFTINGDEPPLPYADAEFDFAYAISVFTHLDEERQFQWLAELRRVVQPGGILIVSLHNAKTWSDRLPAEGEETLAREGVLFMRDDYWRRSFPSWYQTAIHTPTYVKDRYRRYFDVVEHLPRGLNRDQDLVVMKRRP